MDTEARMTRRARRPGRVQLAVVVRRIDEPVDLDAWLERYLAALLQAIQTAHARRHRRAEAYPLSGLVTCAHCGDVYTGGGGPKGPPEDPDRYRFYRHSVHGRQDPEAAARIAATCPAAYGILPRRVIEPAVIGAIADTLEDPTVQRRLAQALDRLLGRVVRPAGTTTAGRAELLRRRDRLVNLAASGTLRPDEIEAQLAVIRGELERLDQASQAERFLARRATAIHSERSRLLEMARDFRRAAQRLAAAELRELVRPWIQSAVADRVAATLTLSIRAVPADVRLATGPEPDSQPQALAVVSLGLPTLRHGGNRRRAGGAA